LAADLAERPDEFARTMAPDPASETTGSANTA
jgi:hypothetical protein